MQAEKEAVNEEVVRRVGIFSWELAEWGKSQSSRRCEDKAAGKCHGSPLGSRDVLVRSSNMSSHFCSYSLFQQKQKNPFLEADVHVLQATEEWDVFVSGAVKWLVWLQRGMLVAHQVKFFYRVQKCARRYLKQREQLWSLGLESGEIAPAHSLSLVSLTNSVWQLEQKTEREDDFLKCIQRQGLNSR